MGCSKKEAQREPSLLGSYKTGWVGLSLLAGSGEVRAIDSNKAEMRWNSEKHTEWNEGALESQTERNEVGALES